MAAAVRHGTPALGVVRPRAFAEAEPRLGAGRRAGLGLAAALALLVAAAGPARAGEAAAPGPCLGPAVGVAVPLCRQIAAHQPNGPWIPSGRRLTYASGRPREGEVRRLDRFGLEVAEITGALAARYRITQSVAGVVVVGIAPAGPAAGKGLAVGDVIVELDQQPVAGPGDLSRRLEAVGRAPATSALLLLYRDYEHRFQVLALD